MKKNLLGVDVGGTKCAIIYGIQDGATIDIVDKVRFDTTVASETIERLLSETIALMKRHKLDSRNTAAIGISCGGPLDSKKGVVMSPPNLPGWDNVPITEMFEKCTGLPTALQNDANACALAEYTFGAGRGYKNVVFLTFGTGLGAGLILDGRLYVGTNDNAGELGHIRLSEFGPVGYGKRGSFEGFASGGGIAQLARTAVMECYQNGETVNWCLASQIEKITAKQVAEAADNGDPLAKEIYRQSALYLGKGLSIVIDLLNPEVIIIGSVYARNESKMKPYMEEVIAREALKGAAAVCQVKPAELGESIGDYAALSVAANLNK